MIQVYKTVNEYDFSHHPKVGIGCHMELAYLAIYEYSKLNVRNITLIKHIKVMSQYKIVILFLQILNNGTFCVALA